MNSEDVVPAVAEYGPPVMWTIDEFASYIRKPKRTVYQWRQRHYGPPSFKVGREIRYFRGDVVSWVMRECREDVA